MFSYRSARFLSISFALYCVGKYLRVVMMSRSGLSYLSDFSAALRSGDLTEYSRLMEEHMDILLEEETFMLMERLKGCLYESQHQNHALSHVI